MILKVLIIAFLVASLVNATTFENCDLLHNGESIQPVYDVHITDVEAGTILDLKTVDVESFEMHNNGDYKYFKIKFDTSLQSFQLSIDSEVFENIESEKPSQPLPTRLLLVMTIICKSYSYLYLDIYVFDTNNHIPEITTEEFVYNIPLPFATRIPVQYFGPGKNLTATDIDIQNDVVTFRLIPDNIFQVLSVRNDDFLGKIYIAIITAIKPITSLEVNSFSIIAMDKDGVESFPKKITIIGHPDPDWDCSCNIQNVFYKPTY